MGVVLAAQHLVLGERVAIKLLLPDAIKVEGVIQRFQREARAVARIQSEHVARVMDVGVLDNGSPYLVMEYVEGRDLADELAARGPLPVEEAVNYVMQAAVGVAEAHALGIVHRDLKPPNLFLAKLSGGRTLVKVLDFGIAKDVADQKSVELTNTFSALGSAAYMSPEQVRMAKSVDPRSDVWALGVVLFELLTDNLPFDGESVTAIAAGIIADPPKSLASLRPDVPPALEAAVLACLEKDRERRTASVALLATAIAPWGGRKAAVLASRIAAALSHEEAPPPQTSQPEISVNSMKAVTAEIIPIDVELDPALTNTGIDPTATLLARSGPPRRTWFFVAAGAVLVALVAIGIVLSRPSREATIEPLASSTSSVEPAPLASAPPEVSFEPAVVATASASAAPKAPAVAAPAQRRSWTKRSAPSGRPTASSKPKKKPMITDL